MKKKKIASLFVGILVSMFLIACSDSEKDNDETKSNASSIDYPDDAVTMIIPWGSGGNADLFARNAAKVMEENIGESTVVENQTGAGGEVAITNFAVEQPDPHTLITTSASNFSLTPQFKEVKYEQDNFKPVVGSFFTQFVLMTNPSKTGIESLDELKEYAKDKKIKFGTTGPAGTDSHTIQAALFKEMGIEAESVVLDGGMELVNNLLGGHIDVTLGIQPLADQYFQSGELKPLATFSPEPYELEGVDPIPTLPDEGYDVVYRSLNFVNAARDTPDEIVNYLYDEYNTVYEDEDFQEFLEENSIQLAPMNGGEIEDFIKEQSKDMERFLKMIAE